MPTTITLGELAQHLQAELVGEADIKIDGIATLLTAQPHQLSFLSNPAYRDALEQTRAGVVILHTEHLALCPTNALLADNPYLAYAKAAELFVPQTNQSAAIHPSAVIADSAKIADQVSIGPNVVIEAKVHIGSGCAIGAGSYIGSHCVLGEHCQLAANVTLQSDTVLGDRVIIHPGAVLGADGFGLAFDRDHWHKIPQLGRVIVGDDCEIGANTTIDRGAIEDTVLEQDVRLDNLVQIAHNVRIGAHTAIAGCAGIAGSTKIGSYCQIGGAAGVAGHLEICDRVTITAMTMVTRSIDEPGAYSSGLPAQPHRAWQRNLHRIKHLDPLAKRVIHLEKLCNKKD